MRVRRRTRSSGSSIGDTLEMDIDLWPSLRARSTVRIKGLDTPELRGPACERSLAQRARDYLATLAIGREARPKRRVGTFHGLSARRPG